MSAEAKAKLEEMSEGNDTRKVVLAALFVGANQRRVQRLTGLPAEFVREKAERLKASHVWLPDGKVACEDPENGPDGLEVALWELIADGMIEAVPA